MTFYLLFGSTDDAHMFPTVPPRHFIDAREHKRAEVVDSIEAASWLGAREVVADKHFL